MCSSCPKKLTGCLLVDFTAAGVVSLVAALKYLAKYLRVIIGHWSAKCVTAAVNYFPMGERKPRKTNLKFYQNSENFCQSESNQNRFRQVGLLCPVVVAVERCCQGIEIDLSGSPH